MSFEPITASHSFTHFGQSRENIRGKNLIQTKSESLEGIILDVGNKYILKRERIGMKGTKVQTTIERDIFVGPLFSGTGRVFGC